MIMLLGDIHGNTHALELAYREATEAGIKYIVQVGDIGLFPDSEARFLRAAEAWPGIDFYFIDGNHDNVDRWVECTEITRVFKDLPFYYVPRGAMLELDGRRFLCIGGGASIDKSYRLARNLHWSYNENISFELIEQLLVDLPAMGEFEAMIAHVPPLSIVDRFFDSTNKLNFGVSLDWFDVNMKHIERIWKYTNYPRIYCGHMHTTMDEENCRILSIDERLVI